MDFSKVATLDASEEFVCLQVESTRGMQKALLQSKYHWDPCCKVEQIQMLQIFGIDLVHALR